MSTSVRPWATTGIALLSVGAITVAPIALPPAFEAPRLQSVAVELTAIPEILTLPVLRQYIANQINDLIVRVSGWAQAGVGLVESLALIPSTVVTATRQLLAGDLTGALTTISDAAVASIVAIGGPLLGSVIERRQRYLAVQTALQLAVPQALIALTVGVGSAVGTVTDGFIMAGQGVVDALLPPNLVNLVTALVDGTVTVVNSFFTAGGQVVDGIVAAQQTLAAALATPAPSTTTATFATVATSDVAVLPDFAAQTVTVASGHSTPEVSAAEIAEIAPDEDVAETTDSTAVVPSSDDSAPTEVVDTDVVDTDVVDTDVADTDTTEAVADEADSTSPSTTSPSTTSPDADAATDDSEPTGAARTTRAAAEDSSDGSTQQ